MIKLLLEVASSIMKWFSERRENKISNAKEDYLKFRSMYELNKDKRRQRNAISRDIDFILRHEQEKRKP